MRRCRDPQLEANVGVLDQGRRILERERRVRGHIVDPFRVPGVHQHYSVYNIQRCIVRFSASSQSKYSNLGVFRICRDPRKQFLREKDIGRDCYRNSVARFWPRGALPNIFPCVHKSSIHLERHGVSWNRPDISDNPQIIFPHCVWRKLDAAACSYRDFWRFLRYPWICQLEGKLVQRAWNKDGSYDRASLVCRHQGP
eukprot:3605133-Rhodomonas_salina.2